MIVTYRTKTTVLLTRPQTVHPVTGDYVTVMPDEGRSQRYRVVEVEWPLRTPPRQYYSLVDEAEVEVQVLLEPCREGEEI
jgi:hypothetical protein